MACNFYNPSKGICMAKFEKYGKEDLADVQTCGCDPWGRAALDRKGQDYCRFDVTDGHEKCQEYIDKTKK